MQSHPVHIPHVVMPMLLQLLADTDDDSVDTLEKYIDALPDGDNTGQRGW